VFECIYWHCNWISPSLSHCNVFAVHIHLHIFVSLYTMTPFPTCYTTTFLFFHSCWSIPIFIQSILTCHVYTSPHIPYSTFYVVTGCMEHSGAQVLIFTNHIFPTHSLKYPWVYICLHAITRHKGSFIHVSKSLNSTFGKNFITLVVHPMHNPYFYSL
jgi:hypothetical protein